MKKVVLFPYHKDLKTLIDFKDDLIGFQIAGLVSYKEDADLIRALNESLGLDEMPYEQLLQSSDAVILLDNYRDYRADKYYQLIDDSIRYEKEIFITPLAQSQLDLNDYTGKYKSLECLPSGIDEYDKDLGIWHDKMYDFDVPIIAVLGQGKHCGKFETSLLLKEVLDGEYKNISILSNPLGALFGCYTMPTFLFQNISFSEKVVKFNHFVRKIAKIDNPDVITIEVSEGIAPFIKKEFHHFAEYPLVITSAVSIDMAVLCTYFMTGSKLEYSLKKIAKFCGNKFNVPIGAFTISRTQFDIPDEEQDRVIFEYLDEPYLSNHYPDLKQLNLPMINIFDKNDAIATIGKSLNRLQENVNAV